MVLDYGYVLYILLAYLVCFLSPPEQYVDIRLQITKCWTAGPRLIFDHMRMLPCCQCVKGQSTERRVCKDEGNFLPWLCVVLSPSLNGSPLGSKLCTYPGNVVLSEFTLIVCGLGPVMTAQAVWVLV